MDAASEVAGLRFGPFDKDQIGFMTRGGAG